MKKHLMTVLFFLGSIVGYSQSQVKIIHSEFIFDQVPFEECHASTLVELSNGAIMAAWFGGEYERHPNVAIWTAKRGEGGWTFPEKVADGKVNDTLSYPTWNPVLFKLSTDELMLFYKEGPSPQTWWGRYKTSSDQGKTWSKSVKLPDGFLGPIKNKPIQLANGTVLSPSSVEDGKGWRAHIEISKDLGKRWKKVDIDQGGEYDVIQPSILEHADGRLQVLCRSKQDYIITAWSSDQGASWTPLEKTKVLNPNSGTDAVTLSNGKFLLVYNPTASGEHWSDGRNELRLAMSDDGVNWEDIYTLEKEAEGEFSYPAIIQGANGEVHISYTWKRKRIKYLKLELKE
ncbi:exo-alpha-sialidase [Echinicola sp. CAU 1574]|uniref:Exo-alpha-sialidase n=1 Tax=Echinicola arenosa TaxID=2774144 RepID=A0ABR9AHE3_9BACT|nr:sialidase family protein [Echinicola arenosa]MBD8488198.1 exo-alpha-sialidase [Echinicola arenosa]